MSKTESAVIGVFTGTVFLAVLFLTGLILGRGIYAACIAAGVGVLLEALFLKGFVRNFYRIDIRLCVAVYVLFSLVFFAVFMGVPVFNLFLGVIAGLYVGRKLYHLKADGEDAETAAGYTAKFTMTVIAVISLMSAFLAIEDPYTTGNLEGMLGIKSFTVTKPMVMWLILLGGSALMLAQYWLTKKSALAAYRMGPVPARSKADARSCEFYKPRD